ncbi:DUF2768 family protein [Brevibacillus ginsengisoli]|uniref:DUF2768 family protein n=1 Tax=Brevibacillus ginsengisoli TaxID=363854 RepID=UPI003CEF17F8
MYISIVAILLMFACNFMIVYARKRSGFISLILKTVAFLLLLAVFLMIITVLLF